MRCWILLAPALLVAACAAEPAQVTLAAEVPAQHYSMAPMPLPAATAVDKSGRPVDVPVVVTAEPPGRVQIKGGQMIPFTPGPVTLSWRAGKRAIHIEEVVVVPVDRVSVGCIPRCDVRVGEEVRVQALAFAGDTPVVDVDVALKLEGEGATLERDLLRAERPTQVKVIGTVGDTSAETAVEFLGKPDRMTLDCQTVFTITRTADGEAFPVCHLTKRQPGSVKVQVFSGDTPVLGDRVEFKVLDERTATINSAGQITALRTGRTSLKASLRDDPFVSAQLGLEIAESARGGLYVGSRFRARARRAARYTAARCPAWRGFTTEAFLNAPGKDAPVRLFCAEQTAVSCAAETIASVRRRGRLDPANLRNWLGSCCCLTEADRDELKELGK